MKNKTSRAIIFFYLLLLSVVCACNKTRVLTINSRTLHSEVVDTEETRTKGLMYRKSLEENEGMLFIFDQNRVVSFWMKNTFIPLSVAFIDSNYKIVNIAQMSPLDEETHHYSYSPVKYALEVNQGWFKKHNIEPGDRVQGIK
ncbi:MAG: DUF192 domain-containing protein [Spirochaetes bacterium]|nr:DUF192 domain-containing protein [Spirochaetota bacterium]